MSPDEGRRPQGALPDVQKKEAPVSFASLLGRTLLVVFAIAGLALASSRFFGWVAFDHRDHNELYSRILDGRAEVRRMAAAEWLRRLQEAERAGGGPELETLRPKPDQVSSLAAELGRAGAECATKEASLVSSVAALLGYATDSVAARPALEGFLKVLKPEDCIEARVMALVSVTRGGEFGAPEYDLFMEAARHPDPSVRKISAFALGLNQGGQAREVLSSLLKDPVEDVRWNAAIALSGSGNVEVIGILKDLLDQASHVGTKEGEELTSSRFEVFREAFRAARKTGDANLAVKVKVISQEHPNLKLRQAAKEILK